MSVYKRGDKWGVDVVYPDGRRVKQIIGTRKKDAEAVETKLKQEILENRWQVRFLPRIRFDQFLKKYLEHIRKNLSQSTYRSNEARIKKHIAPFFGKTPLANISRKQIDSYQFSRSASPNTLRNEIHCLSNIFRLAIRWGYIHHNPVNGIDKPKIPKQPPKYLAPEAETILIAHCEEHIEPIVITALNTGMRKGELLNLKWSDIDLEKREIVVRSKEDWHTKNYDYRLIGINNKLFSVLSTLKRNGEYVFTYRGERVKDIKKSIATAYRKAGIPHYNQPLHILRHTFATRLIQKGTPLEKIQVLLGHKDFSTTLQYAHLTSRSVKDEVNKLT